MRGVNVRCVKLVGSGIVDTKSVKHFENGSVRLGKGFGESRAGERERGGKETVFFL